MAMPASTRDRVVKKAAPSAHLAGGWQRREQRFRWSNDGCRNAPLLDQQRQAYGLEEYGRAVGGKVCFFVGQDLAWRTEPGRVLAYSLQSDAGIKLKRLCPEFKTKLKRH
jgi:hypothetical protein